MAEKEYIERSEAKRIILENEWKNPVVPNVVNMILDRVPAADVVEVVRCKDCKHYKEYLDISTKEPTGWGKCTSIAMDIDLMRNDFCSYGERKQK